MNRIISLITSLLMVSAAGAQTLTLDSCRAMALRSNKHISISRLKQQVAVDARKSARKKYLPHVDVLAGWELMSKEISILNDEQKDRLKNVGTNTVETMNPVNQKINNGLKDLVIGGEMSPTVAQSIGDMFQSVTGGLAQFGNGLGEKVVDAFRTDTRSIFAASVMLRQPLYMGGAITAANRMADIAEDMAGMQTEAAEQNVLYNIDQAYWMVVSLRHKQQLADKYLALVEKLNRDVHKMIETGVATRADGLMVDVRVNEAEMTKTQVDNGLALAKMLLCQLCGLPLESNVTLADEAESTLSEALAMPYYHREAAIELRPEMQLLASAVKMSETATKLVRSASLPQLALTGGYLLTNPNIYNGYERKLGGMWNVGIMLRVPVIDWGENMYRIRASRTVTNMARLEYDDAQELINLQITQCEYKLNEANKKLLTAQKNIQRAEENMRCANIGFQEGVMQASEVMAAQTAWLQAQTQHVDAEIDVRLSAAGLRKALGIK